MTDIAAITRTGLIMCSLAASGLHAVEVHLDWDDNSESDLSHYTVHRSTVSGFTADAGNRIGGDRTTSDYVDASVSDSTTYYYLVRAVDSSGNISPASTEVSASIPAPTPPTRSIILTLTPAPAGGFSVEETTTGASADAAAGSAAIAGLEISADHILTILPTGGG